MPSTATIDGDADRDRRAPRAPPAARRCAARASPAAGRRRPQPAGGALAASHAARARRRRRRPRVDGPSRISTRRGSDAAMLAVVGDDHDDRRARRRAARAAARGSRRRCARRGCRSARRRAGSPAGRPAPGRSRRAGARRRRARRAVRRARWPSPTRSSAAAAQLGGARARGTPGVEQPVGDVVERRSRPSSRKNCWKTKPIRRARSADELAVAERGDVAPVDAHGAGVGRSSVPITCSSVDLPEPDGPTIATSSPLLDARGRRRAAPRRRPG